MWQWYETKKIKRVRWKWYSILKYYLMKIINVFLVIYIYNLAFTVKGFKVIYYCNELLFFLNWGFTPCKTDNPLWGLELQEKQAQKEKDYSIQEICLERTYS